MNGKVILTIVAAIVLVHVFVIYLFVRDGRAHKAPPPAPAAAPALPGAVPGAPGPASVPGSATLPGAPAARPGLPAPAADLGSRNPNFGKPFNYANAVRGNIGSVPDSNDMAAGVLVDLDTRQVLWAKDAKSPLPIASMTKMMTMLIAYEDVLEARNGLTLDTQIKVSPSSTKIGGSQVYLDPKESFTLRELLEAVAIKSANDAAYLVAEYIGQNDVASFVQRMNAKAKSLNMSSTTFHNPHGLPEKPSSLDNVSSAEDMAILAEHVLEHKQLVDWASTRSIDFREPGSKGHMVITNHNHLVPGADEACPGVDGLKTGFINRSGFCITVSCKRGGKRLVAVTMGAPTRKGRDAFMRKLLDWGYKRAANPGVPEPAAPAPKTAAKKTSGAAAESSKQPAKAPAKKPVKKSPASEDERASKKLKSH